MCLYANTLLKCPSLCPLKRSGRKREEKREKWKECSQCNQNSLLCIEAQTVAPCAKGVPTQLWYGNPRTNRAITARTEARHLHNHSALPSGTQIKRGREGDQERERERERQRERGSKRERERGRGRRREREREREREGETEREGEREWEKERENSSNNVEEFYNLSMSFLRHVFRVPAEQMMAFIWENCFRKFLQNNLM